MSFKAKNDQKMAFGDIAKSFYKNSSQHRGTLENTYLHVLGQGFITVLFGDGVANFSAHLHERSQGSLLTGDFTEKEINQAIDNYADLINNQWGQKFGNEIKDQYDISSSTVWSPELTANVLNAFQSKISETMGIKFKTEYTAEDDFVIKLTEFFNKNR